MPYYWPHQCFVDSNNCLQWNKPLHRWNAIWIRKYVEILFWEFIFTKKRCVSSVDLKKNIYIKPRSSNFIIAWRFLFADSSFLFFFSLLFQLSNSSIESQFSHWSNLFPDYLCRVYHYQLWTSVNVQTHQIFFIVRILVYAAVFIKFGLHF